jgi:hypothetical protein
MSRMSSKACFKIHRWGHKLNLNYWNFKRAKHCSFVTVKAKVGGAFDLEATSPVNSTVITDQEIEK